MQNTEPIPLPHGKPHRGEQTNKQTNKQCLFSTVTGPLRSSRPDRSGTRTPPIGGPVGSRSVGDQNKRVRCPHAPCPTHTACAHTGAYFEMQHVQDTYDAAEASAADKRAQEQQEQLESGPCFQSDTERAGEAQQAMGSALQHANAAQKLPAAAAQQMHPCTHRDFSGTSSCGCAAGEAASSSMLSACSELPPSLPAAPALSQAPLRLAPAATASQQENTDDDFDEANSRHARAHEQPAPSMPLLPPMPPIPPSQPPPDGFPSLPLLPVPVHLPVPAMMMPNNPHAAALPLPSVSASSLAPEAERQLESARGQHVSRADVFLARMTPPVHAGTSLPSPAPHAPPDDARDYDQRGIPLWTPPWWNPSSRPMTLRAEDLLRDAEAARVCHVNDPVPYELTRVYAGRQCTRPDLMGDGGRWGNPFTIKIYHDAAAAVFRFAVCAIMDDDWIEQCRTHFCEGSLVACCWCRPFDSPRTPCHAAFIIRVAGADEEELARHT
jgi:hypothetical protein